MNQGHSWSRENAKASQDQSCAETSFLDGHSTRLHSSEEKKPNSLPDPFCSTRESPEGKEKEKDELTAPCDQTRAKVRSVRADKFVLVPPGGSRDTSLPTNETSQDDGLARSEDHSQYLLLPRPTLHTWNSLSMSSENANEVSFSGKSDNFSSPSLSFNFMSDSTSQSSATVDATETDGATPSSGTRQDFTGGASKHSDERVKTGPPILDFSSTRPFTLLPNFTPPRVIQSSISTEAYPKLNLLQRKEQRSNPFSHDVIAEAASLMPARDADDDLAKLPVLPSRFANHLVDLYDEGTPTAWQGLNPKRPPSPTWTMSRATKSPQPEAFETIQNGALEPIHAMGQDFNEFSYLTPSLQKGHSPYPSKSGTDSSPNTSTGLLPSGQQPDADLTGGG